MDPNGSKWIQMDQRERDLLHQVLWEILPILTADDKENGELAND